LSMSAGRVSKVSGKWYWAVLLFSLVLAVGMALGAREAGAQTTAPLEKVLVFSKTAGFRHDSIPNGIAAIQQLGTENGFQVDATEDATHPSTAHLPASWSRLEEPATWSWCRPNSTTGPASSGPP
jgi:Trehalose utilisation